MRKLKINGGRVDQRSASNYLLSLPATPHGYSDAQIDDYGSADGNQKHPGFLWRPGTTMCIEARFSHSVDNLMGTAGFGFWNAPFADPTVRRLALPQATWFFFGSPPTNLPLAPDKPGSGWFAATLDAGALSALMTIPIAPIVILLNQFKGIRKRVWPKIQQWLGMGYAQMELDMRQWHTYRLEWRLDGCTFIVDDECILETKQSPRGPLGFVCWLDNQYMVAKANGRFASGTLATQQKQWLEVEMAGIEPASEKFNL